MKTSFVQTWCCHHLLDLTFSASLPADHEPTHTHTESVYLKLISKHYEALGTGQTQFGIVSNGRDYLLSTLVASSLLLTICQRIPYTISPATPPQKRTELSTKTNKGSLSGGWWLRMWHAGGFLPSISSALQLWQDVSGDEKLARIRGGWGQMKVREETLTRTTTTEGT